MANGVQLWNLILYVLTIGETAEPRNPDNSQWPKFLKNANHDVCIPTPISILQIIDVIAIRK